METWLESDVISDHYANDLSETSVDRWYRLGGDLLSGYFDSRVYWVIGVMLIHKVSESQKKPH